MKKIILFMIILLSTTLFAQPYTGNPEIQGGYMNSGAAEQIIAPYNLEVYNILTITDTTDATPDTIYVYVADSYFGDYVQVGVRNMLDWIEYEYILTSTIADTPVHYLILNPFAWKIKLVKNTGGVTKWVYEGR